MRYRMVGYVLYLRKYVSRVRPSEDTVLKLASKAPDVERTALYYNSANESSDRTMVLEIQRYLHF